MSKIFISPSTQEHNAYWGGSNEEAEMRELSTLVVKNLKAAGFDVKMGGTVSASNNATLGNNFMGAVGTYVAIHSNAGGGRGTEVWHYTGSKNGERLARAIYAELAPETASPDRGVKSSKGYIELYKPLSPSVIVEVAFHDYPADATEIKAKHQEYADAITTGILNYLGVEIEGVPPVTPTPPKPPAPKPPVRYVATGDVWLRSRPMGRKLHVVKKGSNLNVRGRTLGWYKVLHNGVNGVVWGKYVKKIG